LSKALRRIYIFLNAAVQSLKTTLFNARRRFLKMIFMHLGNLRQFIHYLQILHLISFQESLACFYFCGMFQSSFFHLHFHPVGFNGGYCLTVDPQVGIFCFRFTGRISGGRGNRNHQVFV